MVTSYFDQYTSLFADKKKNYRSILSLEKLLVNHRLKGGKDRPSNIRDANIDWLMLLKMATLYIEAPW